MPRLNPVDRIPDDLAVHMKSVPGVPGRVSNVYATVARNPAMFPAFCVFADAVNRRGKLSDRLRELVVLRVGWLSGAEYEFGHHTVRALSVGFTTEEIRRITQPRPVGWSPRETVLLSWVDELFYGSRVGRPMWDALLADMGEEAAIEVLMLAGFYQLVCGFLNSVGVELEPGVPGWPGPSD
jgi:4-carboxymuconolactone decarboxylase